MAQLGPSRKTQRLRRGKEIPHLVHFHHDTVGMGFAINMMCGFYLTGGYGSITKSLFFRQGRQAALI
jgi:hypothetical protein